MNKKLLSLLLAVFAVVSFSSCSSDDDDATFTNYVYLSTAAGTPLLTENATEVLNIKVMITSSLKNDLDLTFKILDNGSDYVELDGNPVVLVAGEKTSSFGVKSLNKGLLLAPTSVKIVMEANSSVILKDTLTVQLLPSPSIPELTLEQQALIESYRANYDINIVPLLGNVTCNTHVSYPGDAYLSPLVSAEEIDLTGQTVITLSENATADKIVLKMTSNPMGINAYLYTIMRDETIDNDEYWFGEYAGPYYTVMCDAVNLTKTSEETFTTTLDNIVIDPTDKSVSFIGDKVDQYDDVITVVPFKFSYSANDRWQELVEAGNSFEITSGDDVETLTAAELEDYGATLNPDVYLNITDIVSDGWENEPSDWVAPTATFDDTEGTLTFTFPMDHYNAGGYFKVTSTYSF